MVMSDLKRIYETLEEQYIKTKSKEEEKILLGIMKELRCLRKFYKEGAIT